MPIYEYTCGQCGKLTDVLQKVDDPAPARCEQCGAEGQMTRMVSRTSFVLKGGGWYSDLYGSTKKDATSAAAAPSSEKGATAPSSTSTSAPAAAGSPAPSSTAASPAPAAAPKTEKK